MSPFDLLVNDLMRLDEARARQQQAARARRRHTELMKAINAPPVDFTPIHREQTRLQARIADDRERRARAQCAASIAKLDQAARSGRLTGIEAGRLDAIKSRFGAMTPPFTPPYPNSPRAA